MTSLQTIKGDGGSLKVTADDLARLKKDIPVLDSGLMNDVWTKRLQAENVRYCRWNGQAPDGRKHADYLGEGPLPFEGAMDAQIRTADKICNLRVAEYVASIMWPNIRTSGTESGDGASAAKIKTLVLWLVRNQWAQQWVNQMELLAQYQEGDSPGAAVCFVDWRKERALELRTITPADLAGIIAEMVQQELSPDMQADIVDMATNPLRADELRDVLAGIFPTMRKARIADVIRQLHETGQAEFPAPYVKVNMPVIEALRVYEDIFFPLNTLVDLQRARVIYRRKWVTRAEGLEIAATEGWDEQFVKDVFGDGKEGTGAEGKSAFFDYNRFLLTRATRIANAEPRRGLYEIVFAYERLVNDDGIPGIYITTFSGSSEVAAKDRELFNRKHGKYPFVAFTSESITSFILDSRGVPERAVTHQNEQKLYRDSTSDHVQQVVNPPLIKPAGKARYDLLRAPFGEIDAGPRDRVEYLKGPDYPRIALDMMAVSEKDIAEYFGLPHKDLDPSVTLALRQHRINRFLASVGEVLYMAVELCQQFMTDADLQRVVGGAGMEVPRTTREIQGRYDLVLCVDVRDWDMEFLKQKAEIFLNYIKRLDPHNIVDNDPLAASLLSSIDPNLAEQAVKPANFANAQEIAAATDAFVKCLNGVRPDMSEGGINAQLRLQVFQGLVQARQAVPAAYPPLSPAAAALIEEYMKYLQFQGQQMVNAQTGRLGVDTAKTDQQIVQAGGAV